MTTRFILIRHGQTDWNRGAERFRGRADVPLNDLGLVQAQKIATRLAREKISAIYSSPMQRTLHTAQPIAGLHKLTVQSHPGLLDIDFGSLEGMTIDEARAAFPEVIEKWMATPGKVKFPKGSSLRAVKGRIANLFQDLIPRHDDETVALVSHRIVCATMLCVVLGLETDALWRVQQDNACVNIFEKREHSYVVTLMNDVSHL